MKNNLIEDHMEFAKSLACIYKRKLPKFVDFDDILQQAYVGLVECAQKYNEAYGSFKTWAYTRINGSIVDYLRKQKNTQCLDESPEMAIRLTPNVDLVDFLEEKTGKQTANMFIMFHIENYSLKEIGEKYNLTNVRISQIISKAENKMKLELAA